MSRPAGDRRPARDLAATRHITALLTKTEADVEQGRSAVASGMQHLAAEAGTLKTHVEPLLTSVRTATRLRRG
jgi:hypothetical protein